MTTMDPSASASASGGNASGHKALWAPWATLWNSDLDQTGRIIAPDFVAHAAPITGVGPEEMHGRGTLRGWVGGARAAFPDMRFETKVGPFADGDFVIGRWQARGTCLIKSADPDQFDAVAGVDRLLFEETSSPPGTASQVLRRGGWDCERSLDGLRRGLAAAGKGGICAIIFRYRCWALPVLITLVLSRKRGF